MCGVCVCGGGGGDWLSKGNGLGFGGEGQLAFKVSIMCWPSTSS